MRSGVLYTMASIEALLGMVATEAVEGRSTDHYFDETKDPDYGKPNYIRERPYNAVPQNSPKLPPIRFDLELVEMPDGSLKWVD
jgi:hypothetical protein